MIGIPSLSYLEVAVLSSMFPAIFVTSYEVMNSPIEGPFARCGGSVFVDRRSKTTVRNDIRVLSGLLMKGFNIVVFPEATSSSGETVLPFKSSLLNAALITEVEILPVCLNYTFIDSERITALNRDKIFYYGEMRFIEHLLGLLHLRLIDLEVTFLECVPAEISDRKSVATLAFRCISDAYVAVH